MHVSMRLLVSHAESAGPSRYALQLQVKREKPALANNLVSNMVAIVVVFVGTQFKNRVQCAETSKQLLLICRAAMQPNCTPAFANVRAACEVNREAVAVADSRCPSLEHEHCCGRDNQQKLARMQTYMSQCVLLQQAVFNCIT